MNKSIHLPPMNSPLGALLAIAILSKAVQAAKTPGHEESAGQPEDEATGCSGHPGCPGCDPAGPIHTDVESYGYRVTHKHPTLDIILAKDRRDQDVVFIDGLTFGFYDPVSAWNFLLSHSGFTSLGEAFEWAERTVSLEDSAEPELSESELFLKNALTNDVMGIYQDFKTDKALYMTFNLGEYRKLMDEDMYARFIERSRNTYGTIAFAKTKEELPKTL
jgi:hypothetical protein